MSRHHQSQEWTPDRMRAEIDFVLKNPATRDLSRSIKTGHELVMLIAVLKERERGETQAG